MTASRGAREPRGHLLRELPPFLLLLLLAHGALAVRAESCAQEEIFLLQRLSASDITVEKLLLSAIEAHGPAEAGPAGHLPRADRAGPGPLDQDEPHGPAAVASGEPHGPAAASEAVESGPPGLSDANAYEGATHRGRTGMMFLAGGSLVAVFIGSLFRSRGPGVVMQVIVYVAALSTIQLSVKLVQDVDHFPFPVFLTLCHFVCAGLVAFTALPFAQSSVRWPTRQQLGTFFLPIALLQALSTGTNNMALLRSSAGFVEIVGNTTPVMTVCVMLLLGQPFHRVLLPPLGVLLAGLALASTGDLSFAALGLALALVATLTRSVKATLQQMLLRDCEEAERHTPLEVLAWCSVPLSLITAAWFLCEEGLAPVRTLASARLPLVGAILLSCANAVVLNLAQLYCIKEIGAVGSQIIAPAKTILVVLGGVTLLGETISRLQGAGFALVMVGVWRYNRLDAGLEKERREARGPRAEKGGARAQGSEETSSTCSGASSDEVASAAPWPRAEPLFGQPET